MDHQAKLHELAHGNSDNCAAIEKGADMAAVLDRASPSKARSFAIMMHERACAVCDDTALAFWGEVLSSLP